jgi:hypothetical protein
MKTVAYKFCTKSAKSGGGEKRPERKNFGSLLARRSPEVYVRRPVFIGIFARLKGDREFWTRTRWRRERNWIPTFSRRIALRYERPCGDANQNEKAVKYLKKFAVAPEPRKRGKYARIE